MAIADLNHRMILDDAIGYISNTAFPSLSGFSTVWGGVVDENETLAVPIIGAGGAAAAYNAATNNWLDGAAVNTTALELKPGKPLKADFIIDPDGMTNIGSMQKLFAERMQVLGNGLANVVFATILKANFATEHIIGAANAVTGSKAIATRRLLGGANKHIILNADATTALLQDIHATGNDQSSRDALVEGQIARLAGCNVWESDLFSTAGAEKLVGCITNGSGIAAATCVRAPVDTSRLLAFETATDERTGLTVGYRAVVNDATDEIIGSFFCSIQAKVARTDGLVRLVTAAT
jgi:hypothetical protein